VVTGSTSPDGVSIDPLDAVYTQPRYPPAVGGVRGRSWRSITYLSSLSDAPQEFDLPGRDVEGQAVAAGQLTAAYRLRDPDADQFGAVAVDRIAGAVFGFLVTVPGGHLEGGGPGRRGLFDGPNAIAPPSTLDSTTIPAMRSLATTGETPRSADPGVSVDLFRDIGAQPANGRCPPTAS